MALSCKQKIDHSSFVNNSFKMKSYLESLSTVQARWKFKLLSHMTPLAMNFKREKRFRDNGWICLGCQGQQPARSEDSQSDPPLPPSDQEPAFETEQHVLHCWAYSDLREGKDLSRDEDLIRYFQDVFKRRADSTE